MRGRIAGSTIDEYSKLKGTALREAYAEVVGRDTNETSRERLLNGIARVLYHDAEMAPQRGGPVFRGDSEPLGP